MKSLTICSLVIIIVSISSIGILGIYFVGNQSISLPICKRFRILNLSVDDLINEHSAD